MGLDMYAFTTSKDVMHRDFLRSSDDANFKNWTIVSSIGENFMN